MDGGPGRHARSGGASQGGRRRPSSERSAADLGRGSRPDGGRTDRGRCDGTGGWRRAAMTEFSADWLALREPADKAARSLPLSKRVAERLAGQDPVRVLDLGTGTGANLRFLAELFAAP